MMIVYIEKVIFFSNMEHAREEDDLPLTQRAMCIFDFYADHRGQKLIDLLDRKGIIVVFVIAACTDRIQPHALIHNKIYIDHSNFYTVVSLLIILICNEKKVQSELMFVSTTTISSRYLTLKTSLRIHHYV